MMIGRQDSHCVIVPWNDFTLKRKYATTKSGNKRGAKKHIGG